MSQHKHQPPGTEADKLAYAIEKEASLIKKFGVKGSFIMLFVSVFVLLVVVIYMATFGSKNNTNVAAQRSQAGWLSTNTAFNDRYGSGRSYTTDSGYNPTRQPAIQPVPTSGSSLVINGDFESPIVPPNGQGWETYANGTPGLNWNMEFVNSAAHRYFCTDPYLELQREVNGWRANTGNQYAELDSDCFHSDQGGYIYDSLVDMKQTIPTTPGAVYELKFSFAARPGTDYNDNKLTVLFGGQKVAELSADGQSNNGEIFWQTYTYYVTANSSQTELRFSPRNSYADSYGVFVDSVSLKLVNP